MPSFWPSSSSGPSAAAAEGDPADPAHLSASDFVDGDHPRDEVYGASFQTRSVALDGLTIHHLLEEFKGIKPQKKFHATRSIMDYADEKIVSFEELEPEERTY